jgi:hypothetical protein
MNDELTYRRLTTIGGHPDSSVIGIGADPVARITQVLPTRHSM